MAAPTITANSLRIGVAGANFVDYTFTLTAGDILIYVVNRSNLTTSIAVAPLPVYQSGVALPAVTGTLISDLTGSSATRMVYYKITSGGSTTQRVDITGGGSNTNIEGAFIIVTGQHATTPITTGDYGVQIFSPVNTNGPVTINAITPTAGHGDLVVIGCMFNGATNAGGSTTSGTNLYETSPLAGTGWSRATPPSGFTANANADEGVVAMTFPMTSSGTATNTMTGTYQFNPFSKFAWVAVQAPAAGGATTINPTPPHVTVAVDPLTLTAATTISMPSPRLNVHVVTPTVTGILNSTATAAFGKLTAGATGSIPSGGGGVFDTTANAAFGALTAQATGTKASVVSGFANANFGQLNAHATGSDPNSGGGGGAGGQAGITMGHGGIRAN